LPIVLACILLPRFKFWLTLMAYRQKKRLAAAQTPRGIRFMNWIIINLWIAMIFTHVAIIRAYLNKGTPASPAAIATAPDSELTRNWKAQLVATILRNQRYPEAARSRGEQGVVRPSLDVGEWPQR
jgi:hypothetical protein